MATKGYLGDHELRVEKTLLDDVERSQAEQDKDRCTRTRPRMDHAMMKPVRDEAGAITMEEYTWTYSDEWWLVGALAEWYEEQHLADWAAAISWMVAHKKRAYKAGEDGWVWFCDGRIAEGLEDAESDIPPEVYDKMKRAELEEANQKRYKTFREAFEDFANGWLDARASGWVPPEKE